MDIISSIVEFLEIKRPYRIELVSKPNKKYDGLYWAMYSDKHKFLAHKIRVYINNGNRSTNSLIAHELVHVWQEEKGLTEYHGPQFKKMARLIEAKFGLKNVYYPGVDIKNPK